MKANNVNITVGQVFNIGNYQSCRVEVNVGGTVDEGETVSVAAEKAYMEAKKAFAKVVANFVPKKEGGK